MTKLGMTKADPTPALPTLAEAIAAEAAADAEVHRLETLWGGEVSRRVTVEEVTTVFDAHGRPHPVTVPVERTEVELIDDATRWQAKRELVAAQTRLLDARATLALVRQQAQRDARVRDAQLIAEGTAVVCQRLPALIAELQAAQAHMASFATEMAERDRDLGRRYFSESVWPFLLPGGALDDWIRRISVIFGLDDD